MPTATHYGTPCLSCCLHLSHPHHPPALSTYLVLTPHYLFISFHACVWYYSPTNFINERRREGERFILSVYSMKFVSGVVPLAHCFTTDLLALNWFRYLRIIRGMEACLLCLCHWACSENRASTISRCQSSAIADCWYDATCYFLKVHLSSMQPPSAVHLHSTCHAIRPMPPLYTLFISFKMPHQTLPCLCQWKANGNTMWGGKCSWGE